jgi:hypothetical protein
VHVYEDQHRGLSKEEYTPLFFFFPFPPFSNFAGLGRIRGKREN